jgi:UDP-N-acetylglucosamine 2-epimerase (non-hydrolysing)
MIHFIIGTRAQLFKMAPIMLECQRRQLKWRWVYTAQHKETIAESLETFGLPDTDYTVVHWDTEAKSMGKIWRWYLKMLMALPRSRKVLGGHTGKQNIVLTHGDTITTWLGALFGRLTRTPVMHVESGLRSYNWRKPFPEEINRLITFRLTNVYAAPGDWALKNLKKYKGDKINTGENTQIDTIAFGLKHADSAKLTLPKDKYVVASLHRYENVFDELRFSLMIDRLEDITKKFPVYLVQHPVTQGQLAKLSTIKQRIDENKRIHQLPRLEYLPFIKLIKHAEFVVTDGGGNQEELYHMGKPTLLFRDETERQEGLGKTAVISKLNKKIILDFISNYKQYQQPSTLDKLKISPTKMIVDYLQEHAYGE